MSWSMFIDEPGDHQLENPYGVLAGFAVEDTHIWGLTRKLKHAREQFFGQRPYGRTDVYVDVQRILSVDVFKEASSASLPQLPDQVAVRKNSHEKLRFESSNELFLIASQKIAYCNFIIKLMQDYGANAFAIIIPNDSIDITIKDRLRKDYGYFFERFYYFLVNQGVSAMGHLILQEDRKGREYVSLESINEYFTKTNNGRVRSKNIIPEPLFARGDVTEIIQASRILSYCVAWGVRLPKMDLPRRYDMDSLVSLCNSMRFSYKTENGKKDWSFKYVNDIGLS